MPARLAAVALLLILAGCTSSNPTPRASQPTSSPAPTFTSQPPTPTPSAPASASPSPTHFASLEISGSGGCTAMNYGGCWVALLLEQTTARDLFNRVPHDDDLVFADTGFETYPEITIQGPPPNAPKTIAGGHWAVGIGVGRTSDDGSPDRLATSCVREFAVTPEVQHVAINANLHADTCDIEIVFDPAPSVTTKVTIPEWTPPTGGILDNCVTRTTLLRVDPTGRPWLEDVPTGTRIEIASTGGAVDVPDFLGWSVQRSGSSATLLSPDGVGSIAEFAVLWPQCVFRLGDLAWVGGTYDAWLPWERSLGAYGTDAAKWLLEAGRGHQGGPPPAAAARTTPLSGDLDDAVLAALDDEIGASGAAWWSTAVAGVFIGNRVALGVELGGSANSPADVREWQWVHEGESSVLAESWAAWRVRGFMTPRGNPVWAAGERLRVWDDCAKVDMLQVAGGGVGVTASAIDIDGGVVHVVIQSESGSLTDVVADYRDARCRAHPVLGPIIDELVDGSQAPSPLPTAPPRADLIGRLEPAPGEPSCATLVDADGMRWDLWLPSDFVFAGDDIGHLRDPSGTVVASVGDTLAVHGYAEASDRGYCGSARTFEILHIVYVTRLQPAPIPTPTASPLLPTVCDGDGLAALFDREEDAIASFLDRAAWLLTIVVSSADGELERTTIRYDDPACRADAHIGPIIEGALHGYRPKRDVVSDAIGRLIITNPAEDCSLLLGADGWTWNLKWPRGFEVDELGIVRSGVVAPPGALVGVVGKARRGVSGMCTNGWTIEVRRVTLVEQ